MDIAIAGAEARGEGLSRPRKLPHRSAQGWLSGPRVCPIPGVRNVESMQGGLQMFATLVGANICSSGYRGLFDRLYAHAISRGFVPPDPKMPVRADGPIEGWTLELKGPRGLNADFLLAVTAPRVPGLSPIFPVFKTISGPLFAGGVLDSVFVVSRQDCRDISETKSYRSDCMAASCPSSMA